MKLAVSNIGWEPAHLREILPKVKGCSVEGLVIAPTMVWPDAPWVSDREAHDFHLLVEDSGLTIVGMQSLTYGLKGAALSGEVGGRKVLTEHLKRQAELGGKIGAVSLVFGSPGLRQEVDYSQSVDLFSEVADVAASNGTTVCIEPLSGYGSEFITTTREGIGLVEAVGRSGFGLHLDSAAMTADPGAFIESDIKAAAHRVGIVSFDASAPELGLLAEHELVDHARISRALGAVGYNGYISLEMRIPQTVDPVADYLVQVEYMRQHYA